MDYLLQIFLEVALSAGSSLPFLSGLNKKDWDLELKVVSWRQTQSRIWHLMKQYNFVSLLREQR